MKRKQARSLIESLSPEGVPILGYLVWWDLEGIEMTSLEFKDKWDEAGLPSGLCINVRSRTALVKALKELERGKLIRKIIDDESQIVYVIVREDVDSKKRDVEYEKENRVIYDKYTKTLDFKVEGKVPEQIRKAFEKYEGQYTSREVRKVITTTVKHYGGITVRRSGGMYLMTNTLAVGKLQLLVDNLPGTVHQFIPYGILDAPAFRKQALQQIKEELVGDIRKQHTATEKMLGLAAKGRVRPKSLETQQEKLESIKKKAARFTKIGFDPSIIEQEVEKTKGLITKQLRQLEGK